MTDIYWDKAREISKKVASIHAPCFEENSLKVWLESWSRDTAALQRARQRPGAGGGGARMVLHYLLDSCWFGAVCVFTWHALFVLATSFVPSFVLIARVPGTAKWCDDINYNSNKVHEVQDKQHLTANFTFQNPPSLASDKHLTKHLTKITKFP